LADGDGNVLCVVSVRPGGGQNRIVDKIKLEALEAELVAESDRVALVAPGATTRLHDGNGAART